jgi:hypothetical protein
MSVAWKLDDNGAPVMKDGNPVFVDASGAERTVALDTINRLNSEAKSHRERAESAEVKLKDYEGLDAKQAREALEKLSKLDAKQLIDAGKVDEVKHQITTQFQTQLSEKEARLQALESKHNNLIINNVFANSEFLRNNIAVPRDMVEATFRNNFKVEDGQVIISDRDGNRLYSKERAGEFATPEEGLRILVESHPQKDVILKADIGSGSGSNGAGGASGSGRIMKRSEFEALSGMKQAEAAQKAAKGEIKIVD